MLQTTRRKITSFIALTFLLGLNNLCAQRESIDGMLIGPDYVVWEAEATNSPLDMWEIVRPEDDRYYDGGTVPPIGETHLEFTGNDHNGGSANSPLTYTFVCPKTAKYRLGARLYQRLEGQPEDKCNDVYIRMEGNFTSGNSVSTTDLEHDQKFYGRGVDVWGALFNLEIHSTGAHSSALYNMTEGEEYTLTVSGRAQRTNIDYWLLYDNSLPIVMEAHKDVAAENDEKYRPPSISCKTIMAVDMKYTNIDGFVNAQTDNKDGKDILQVVERLEWAAAQYVFDGTDGEATFTLNTMQETDGESSYRLKINGELINEVINDRIHGTDIPDYTIQNHTINDSPVALNDGDTIQIEFSNATNGLVPEGNVTATSRGRWESLELCTSGRFTYYKLNLLKESFSLPPGDSVQLNTELILPDDTDSTLIWSTTAHEIATVDSNGFVKGITEGVAKILVRTLDGEYKDSCEVTVIIPQPYGGAPIAIPGVIEVENYDIGGEGATYHDSGNANEGGKYRTNDGVDIETCTEGGFNIGWTEEGEWLKYTINIAETENYYLEARVASMDKEVKYHVEIDGVDITGSHTFTATGGWQSWKTVIIEDLDLTAGDHSLTFAIEGPGWNINWIRMYVTGQTIDATGISLDATAKVDITKEKTLKAQVLPDNASDQTITWTSLNPTIATVDENGVVKGITIGEATIMAESNDGGYAAMCVVTVKQGVGITSKKATIALAYPNPFENEFTITPAQSNTIKQVIIRDITGKIIFEKKITEAGNIVIRNNDQITLKGLYLIEIIGENEVQTIKMMAK